MEGLQNIIFLRHMNRIICWVYEPSANDMKRRHSMKIFILQLKLLFFGSIKIVLIYEIEVSNYQSEVQTFRLCEYCDSENKKKGKSWRGLFKAKPVPIFNWKKSNGEKTINKTDHYSWQPTWRNPSIFFLLCLKKKTSKISPINDIADFYFCSSSLFLANYKFKVTHVSCNFYT